MALLWDVVPPNVGFRSVSRPPAMSRLELRYCVSPVSSHDPESLRPVGCPYLNGSNSH